MRVTKRTTEARFRLTRLIRKEITRLKSPYALAREIVEKNRLVGRTVKIDDRALTKIAKEQSDVYLTVEMLRALDVYFTPMGESLRLKPIFEQEGIIEPLLESGRITFLMGTKPLQAPRLRDMSVWDARAMAEVLNTAGKYEAPVRYRIREVLLKPEMTIHLATAETWYKVLRADTRSVIAFGAPVASPAAEIMVARMLGRQPFQTPQPPFTRENRLPFYFAWPKEAVVKGFRSAFALTPDELAGLDIPDAAKAANAVRDGEARAFVWEDHVEIVPLEAKTWTMYGTIVAQRRPGGNVWLALCGLTGPATFAAAQLLSKVKTELPFSEDDYKPVLWAPLVAKVVASESSDEGGDDRELEFCEFLQRPRVWPPAPKRTQKKEPKPSTATKKTPSV